jgi:O-antigen ligase
MAVVPIGVLAATGERRPVLRLAAAAATTLVLVAVALTSSRGAAVAFVVVLVALAALGHLRVRHLAAAAACVALVLALVPSYRDRVTSIVHVGGATADVGAQTSTDESVRSRTTEMLAAGLAFADHPVVGVGPGGFPFVYERYARRVGLEIHSSIRWGPQAGQVPQREAHNLLLGIAADLGFAGAAAFVAVVGIAIGDLLAARRRWRRRGPELVRLADGLLLALLAYLAAGAFLSLGFERYLWLLVALAGAAGAMARRGVA